MKFKSILLSLSIFAIFAISFDVSAKKAKTKKMSNSEKAKMILEKAETKSISSILKKKKETNMVNYEITIWKKYFPDGTFAKRFESIGRSKKSGNKIYHKISLKRVDGSYWEIFDNIAIKREDLISKSHVAKKNKKREYTYKVSQVFLKKIPCYKITVAEKNISNLKNTNIAIVCYYIGKKDFYTYQVEYFQKNGVKIPSFPVDDVTQVKSDKIENSLFKVPDNCKIYIAKDNKDGDKLYKLALVKQEMRLVPNYKLAKNYFKNKYGSSNIDEILDTLQYKSKGDNQ